VATFTLAPPRHAAMVPISASIRSREQRMAPPGRLARSLLILQHSAVFLRCLEVPYDRSPRVFGLALLALLVVTPKSTRKHDSACEPHQQPGTRQHCSYAVPRKFGGGPSSGSFGTAMFVLE
jgi:hypothetical protein